MPDLEAVRKILEDSQPRGHCIRLRGLPFSAAARDVAAFLSGVSLAEGPDSIIFTFTADGRPTGEAYVEVADEAAAAAAMQKHKERMGNRYIEVFASTKHDLLQAAQQARFLASQAALRQRWGAAAVAMGIGGGVIPTHAAAAAGGGAPGAVAGMAVGVGPAPQGAGVGGVALAGVPGGAMVAGTAAALQQHAGELVMAPYGGQVAVSMGPTAGGYEDDLSQALGGGGPPERVSVCCCHGVGFAESGDRPWVGINS